MRSVMPSDSAKACSAAAHPCGLMPPALLTTLMPCRFTSPSTGFIAMSTKSVAQPSSGCLARARRQDGHRGFGQVVEHQVVEPAPFTSCARGHHAVAPEPEAPPMRTILLLLVMAMQLSDPPRAALASTR
jgi:hypothetical protein